jgi:hypothetical protein
LQVWSYTRNAPGMDRTTFVLRLPWCILLLNTFFNFLWVGRCMLMFIMFLACLVYLFGVYLCFFSLYVFQQFIMGCYMGVLCVYVVKCIVFPMLQLYACKLRSVNFLFVLCDSPMQFLCFIYMFVFYNL